MTSPANDYRQGVPHGLTCRCGTRRGALYPKSAGEGGTWAVLLCCYCDVSEGDAYAAPGQPPRFNEVRWPVGDAP